MNPQTFNPYVYCLNNPMKYVDPDGEKPEGWPDEIPYRGLSEDYSEEIEEYVEKQQAEERSDPESDYHKWREWRRRASQSRYIAEGNPLPYDYIEVSYEWGNFAYTKTDVVVVHRLQFDISPSPGWPTLPISFLPIAAYVSVKYEYYYKYKVYKRDGEFMRRDTMGPKLRWSRDWEQIGRTWIDFPWANDLYPYKYF